MIKPDIVPLGIDLNSGMIVGHDYGTGTWMTVYRYRQCGVDITGQPVFRIVEGPIYVSKRWEI